MSSGGVGPIWPLAAIAVAAQVLGVACVLVSQSAKVELEACEGGNRRALDLASLAIRRMEDTQSTLDDDDESDDDGDFVSSSSLVFKSCHFKAVD